MYRQELAANYTSLGNVLADTDRPRDAEAALRMAVAVLERLTQEFPLAEYRHHLAHSYNSLGALLYATRRGPKAEAAYYQALAVYQKLTTDSPKVPDYANELAGTLVNLAKLKSDAGNHAAARKLLVQARPYHKQALAANPADANYRRFFRNNLIATCQAFVGLADHAAAAAEAEELARVGYEPGDDAYNAACFVARCVRLAERDSRLREAQRRELARRYADRAMDLLRQAVQAGWKDAAHTKQDSDLDPLRNREDFRKLLGELEGKAKSRVKNQN
jgi:tetratricopeptide (TPR) repeat protein